MFYDKTNAVKAFICPNEWVVSGMQIVKGLGKDLQTTVLLYRND